MYRQQQEQLDKIAQWLEKEKAHIILEKGIMADPELCDRLMERIRGEFYIENALWNADIDYVEIMVQRFLDQV